MFRLKRKPPFSYDPQTQTLFLRASVCTGETTLCLREKKDGRVTELGRLQDLLAALAVLKINPQGLKKEY